MTTAVGSEEYDWYGGLIGQGDHKSIRARIHMRARS